MLRHFYNSLYLTKNEKRGYAILTILILFLFISAKWVIPQFAKPSVEFSSAEIENYKKIAQESKKLNRPSYNFFEFNPNLVSVLELDSMGFPKKATQNLIRYRESGGYFLSPNDLKKIYGLSDSIFQKVEPYLVFENNNLKLIAKDSVQENNVNLPEVELVSSKKEKQEPGFIIDFSKVSFDSLQMFGFSNFASNNIIKYYEKGGKINSLTDLKSIYGVDSNFINSYKSKFIFPENEIVLNFEINTASRIDFEKIPGIGIAYAERILKYREVLGGFCSFSQLNEVYGLADFDFQPFTKQLKIETKEIKKYDLNEVEFKTLLKHPYFEYVDVKIIFEQLKDNPELSLEEILQSPLLNPKHKSKYKFYLQKDE